jgi:hypothetical protein
MSVTTDPMKRSTEGEMLRPSFEIKWIEDSRIEAGEHLLPALPANVSTELSREYAALSLIAADLTFANECFRAAEQHGLPDPDNVQSTALIFSGVVSYARCFMTGVRAQLELKTAGAVDFEIHDYLMNLRNKHVAHSVNDFEECRAAAVIIGRPGGPWRDGKGVCTIMKRSVGLSTALLKRAILHIATLLQFTDGRLPTLRAELYAEFKTAFEKGDKFELVPLVHLSDREEIGKARKLPR